MNLRLLLIASALLVVPSVSHAQVPSVQLPPALDRVLRDYERYWRAGDTTGLASIFTPDGFVPTRQAGWVRGADAIRATYRSARGNLILRAHAFATSDSVGYIIGSYGYDNPNGNGKFVLALRKGADGRWLIAADLDQ